MAVDGVDSPPPHAGPALTTRHGGTAAAAGGVLGLAPQEVYQLAGAHRGAAGRRQPMGACRQRADRWLQTEPPTWRGLTRAEVGFALVLAAAASGLVLALG
jgi:hypothetical protein